MRALWRRRRAGRQPIYKTWFAMWIDMRGFTIPRFARVMLVSPNTIAKWRNGASMTRRNAIMMRSLFPDAPVHALGGPVIHMTEPLPINARSKRMYRFIFRQFDLIETEQMPTEVWPKAVEEARLRHAYYGRHAHKPERSIEPSQSAFSSSPPNPDRVADVLPPTLGGEQPVDRRVDPAGG